MEVSAVVYISCAFWFGGIMILSLLFGGDHDVSADHDISNGHAEGAGEWHAWLNIKVISAFGTAFGASGAIASVNNCTMPISIAIALASGFVCGLAVKNLVGFMHRQVGNAIFNRSELTGKEGTIVMGILDGNEIGEAQFLVAGQLVNFPAKSLDGRPIGQGEKIVVDTVGSVLVVKRPS